MAEFLETVSVNMQLEIDEFIRGARENGFRSGDTRRRAARQYHRAWPVLVSFDNGRHCDELSVPLRNVSDTGLGFVASRPIDVGSKVFIKLFWQDQTRPRLPAVVRHTTLVDEGYLIGCEFLFDVSS